MSELLPEHRKLKYLKQRPLNLLLHPSHPSHSSHTAQGSHSSSHSWQYSLLLWFFEDQLKSRYLQFVYTLQVQYYSICTLCIIHVYIHCTCTYMYIAMYIVYTYMYIITCTCIYHTFDLYTVNMYYTIIADILLDCRQPPMIQWRRFERRCWVTSLTCSTSDRSKRNSC